MNDDKKKSEFRILTVVAGIGFVACFASFIIGLLNSSYISSVMFLLAAIYCMSRFVLCIKTKNGSVKR